MLTKRELKKLQDTDPNLFRKVSQLQNRYKQHAPEIKRLEKEKKALQRQQERERKALQRQQEKERKALQRERKNLERQTEREWKKNEREFRKQQQRKKGLFLETKKTMYNGDLKLYTIKNTRFRKPERFLKACLPLVIEKLDFPKKVHTTFIVQFSKDNQLLDPHYFKRKIEIWPSKDSVSDNWREMITSHFIQQIFNFEGLGSGLILSKIVSLDLAVYNYLSTDE